jgi:hypothetical protein
MKKSGLADSPFFTHPSTQQGEVFNGQSSTPPKSISQPAQNSVQLNNRSNAQLNENTIVQTHNRSTEQTNERSDEQDLRSITRASFDVYEDQVEKMEVLLIKRKKTLKRRVTKGEVMREIIDFYFTKKK